MGPPDNLAFQFNFSGEVTHFAPAQLTSSALADDMHGYVSGAELQRRLVNFLAASADSRGSRDDGGDNNNAFQTLHGHISSDVTAHAVPSGLPTRDGQIKIQRPRTAGFEP
jgi:hypothetical protein